MSPVCARGLTLVEIIVALTVLGIGTAVTAVAMTMSAAEPDDRVRARLERAADSAVRTGAAVAVRHGSGTLRFLPDGSIEGAPASSDSFVITAEPLSGFAHVTRK